MQVKVKVTQSDAVKLNSNQWGSLTINIDVTQLTEAEREFLADKILSARDNEGFYAPVTTDIQLLEWIRSEVAAHDAKVAAEKAEYESRVTGILEADDQHLRQMYIYNGDAILKDPRLATQLAKKLRLERMDKVDQEIKNLRTRFYGEQYDLDHGSLPNPSSYADLPNYPEYQAARFEWLRWYDSQRAKRQTEVAESNRQAQARTDQLATWVARHGTTNQQSRYAAGVLAEEEILAGIEAEAFAPLMDEPLYDKLTGEDIEHDDECPQPDDRYSSVVAETVSAEEWDRIEALRLKLPAAVAEVRRHTGSCRNCEGSVARAGIKLTLTVGELTFAREYAV